MRMSARGGHPRAAPGWYGPERGSILVEPRFGMRATRRPAMLRDAVAGRDVAQAIAHQAHAQKTIEKMAAHQMAAAHKRAMELMEESASARDPDIAIKKARASARLMDAFSRAALTLDRIQRGGGQTIQVQYMQVNAMVGEASGNMQNPSCAAKSKGGRPPTSGYRTNKAIAQRQADRELLSGVRRLQDVG